MRLMSVVPGLLFCWLVLAAPASSGSAPPVVPTAPHSAMPWVRRLAAASADSARESAFYELRVGFDRGELTLETPAQAESLARALARAMLESNPDGVLPWVTAEMLAEYPHPVAADALYELVRRPRTRSGLAHENALKALVTLRDRRVFPLLVVDGQMRCLPRQLVDLGDPRGIEVLERAVVDPGSGPVGRQSAGIAARDLRRRIQQHIYCPFPLEDATVERIQRHGFAIGTETHNEMFMSLSAEYPFVSSDQAFHVFALLARASFGEFDRLLLVPRLRSACRSTFDALIERASLHGDTAAARAAAVLAVPVALLDSTEPARLGLTPAWTLAVEADLRSIRAHARVAPSEVMRREEDFTKYAPRGRYSTGEGDSAAFAARAPRGVGIPRGRADDVPRTAGRCRTRGRGRRAGGWP